MSAENKYTENKEIEGGDKKIPIIITSLSEILDEFAKYTLTDRKDVVEGYINEFLEKNLGSSFDIVFDTSGDVKQIQLFGKDLDKSQTKTCQVLIVPQVGGSINIQLHPHYEPESFYFRMEKVSIDKFVNLAPDFKLILDPNKQGEIRTKFKKYENTFEIDLSDYGY